MSLFDLAFLLLLLAALVSLARAALAGFRGRRSRARTILLRLAGGVAGYFAVLIAVSVLSPRQWPGVGDPQCSDDWCIAVTGVQRDREADSARYEVTFRLSSRARRVTQRERFVVVYLRDGLGRRYDPEPMEGEPPFDVALGPLQSRTTRRRFTVPASATGLGVVVTREGDFDFPGCCIIGDDRSLFHERPVVPIAPPEPRTPGQSPA